MKSISLAEPGKFEQKNIETPGSPGADEALIKIHKIGICGTDYHAYRGKQPFFSYPRILGHELGVEVVALGDNVKHLKVGDKCSVEPYLNCGSCMACGNGKSNCCEKMRVLGVHVDGGMSEFIRVPAAKLHPSGVLNYEELALVETLGIGCHAVNRAEIRAGQKVLVIGAGPIGLSVLEFAMIKGARTTIMDLNTDRLAFCEKYNKAHEFIQADVIPDGLESAFEVVFDATGNPHSMKNAFKYVGHGGKLVFVGLFQGDYAFPDPEFHRKEMSILASRNSLPADFTYIIEQLEQKKIDVQSWISREIPFEEVITAFDGLLTDQTLVKAVITV